MTRKCQHEGECFAQIDMASNIGYEKELADAGLEVEHLTDPDSSAYQAALQLWGWCYI